MNTDLLRYFNEEWDYLRQGVKEFAQRHPQIASRLHVGSESLQDPYFTHLLGAFSLIAGRIRRHQDRHFARLQEGLLEIFFPHYVAPIPAMAIIQARLPKEATAPALWKRGQLLETFPIQGEPLRFTTCYDTTLWPLQIKAFDCLKETAGLSLVVTLPEEAERCAWPKEEKLRFYIREPWSVASQLLEALLTDCLKIQVKDPKTGTVLFHQGAHSVYPVGFEENQALLPFIDKAAPRWRLLMEYFTFKEKFLFFEVDLPPDLSAEITELEWVFYFERPLSTALQSLGSESLALNCTPVINLFKKTLEPLRRDLDRYEERLVVDKHHPMHYEVHTVESVFEVTQPQTPRQISPLWRLDPPTPSSDRWQVQRREEGLFLSLTGTPEAVNASQILEVAASCFNSDLPHRLHLPVGEAHLQLSEPGPALEQIHFVTQPTPVYRRVSGSGELSPFLTQLAHTYLPFTEKESALTYLRGLLSACNVTPWQENKLIADSVLSVLPKQTKKRSSQSKLSPFIWGTHWQVKLKKDPFPEHGRHLFMRVLRESVGCEQPFQSFLDWSFEWE